MKLMLLPAYATKERFDVPLFLTYVLLHLSLLAAPFTYSHAGLIAFGVMYFCSICFGICMGYHRLLAHNSYKTSKFFRYFFTFWGCMAMQRGPIWWVATHRLHHRDTDLETDPHSPTVSFLWSHMLWPFFKHPNLDESPETVQQLSKDLYADPVMHYFERHYTLLNIVVMAALFGIGFLLGGGTMGLSILVWGGFLRLLLSLHATWLVNSATHVWGYRTFETKDLSRNNWFVALVTFGEGWHNNHHHAQKIARNGYHWFEVDIAYYMICLMERVGLASHVARRSERQRVQPISANPLVSSRQPAISAR